MTVESWFDYIDVPATRFELHYGERIVRCFRDRPGKVHDMFAAALALHPDHTAVICGEQTVTYRQLDALIGLVAGGIRARGIGPGDRVALLVGNSIAFVALFYAIARLGAVSVPLNIRQQAAEIRQVLNDCTARLVVHDVELAPRMPLPHEIASVEGVAVVRRPGEDELAALMGTPPVAEAVAVAEDATATILYTSGTTGRPKGAMLTNFGRIHSAIHYVTVMQLTAADRCMVAVPMSHVTGVSALIDAMFRCGGTLIVMPAFKAADFIALAARHRMTYTLIVPAMFNLCLLAPNFAEADLSAWRVSGYGGALMPEVTLERIARSLPGLRLINTYGSTETTSPAVFMPPAHAVARKEAVGLAVPCGHVAVMDEEGREVPPNTPGEIYIGGAMVVPGYWDNPEATRREFRGGYWKSGDLGTMDEKGYIRVIDRIKDVINRGGFKIYATEVENVLLDHPAVIEAAVVAKPCDVLGERVHAFVVVRDAVEDAALAAFCAAQLSDYKVPESFRRLPDTLPRNAAGKVLKRELRQQLLPA